MKAKEIEGAKKILKTIADGKYHGVVYRLMEFSDGKQEEECQVYVSGYAYHNGSSWMEALGTLQEEMDKCKE